MKNSRTITSQAIIIFSGTSMDFHPTSFFILENVQLGTFWVGQAKMVLDECGFSLLPAVTKDELTQKLETICIDYAFPSLDLVSINKNGSLPFYGVERWISKLRYKISKESKKYKELRKLLTAGWHQGDFTDNSTLNVLHIRNKTDLKVLYKRLIDEWEAKGMRCLNAHTCKTRAEKYQDKKKDPEFLKAISRKKVLRQMEKTGKLPKPETLDKHDIREVEIKECMEEVTKESFGFYRKSDGHSNRWFCPCNRQARTCSSGECKRNGEIVGINVGSKKCHHGIERSRCKDCKGGSICDHNRVRTKCKECGGGSICEHNRLRYNCKECGGGSICVHNQIRSGCRKCKGSQICEHIRIRSRCVKCKGSQICKHNKIISHCIECGGSQICSHSKRRSECKICKGSSICHHNKHKQVCIKCNEKSFCEHKILHSTCNICDPVGYLIKKRRSRRWVTTKSKNPTHTLNDLGMTSKEWLVYLNKTFEDTYGRSRTDDDDVHIDEIIPCSAWNLPEDNRYCWHYLNSQWLLASDNLSKSTSYIEDDKEDMIKRINEHLSGIKM